MRKTLWNGVKAMSRKKARKLLLIVLALVFVGTLAAVGWRLWDYHKGEQAYSEAEALVNLPDLDSFPAPTVPELHPTPSSPAPSASSDPAESPAPSTGVPSPVSPVTPADPAPSESAPQPSAYVDPYADIWAAMDFAGLRKVNPDVVGWIMIPGTPVCYPLLQGDDNQYYLNHMWHHGIGSVGSIFLECQNART